MSSDFVIPAEAGFQGGAPKTSCAMNPGVPRPASAARRPCGMER